MSQPGNEAQDGSSGEPAGTGQPQPADPDGYSPSGYAPGGYGQGGHGQGGYGPGNSQPPYGGTSYSQNPYDQMPYEQPGFGQDPYGRAPQGYGQQAGYGQQPGYGPQPYGPTGYPPDPYGQPAYGTATPGWLAQQGGTPSLDQPHYGIGPVDAVKRVFQKYARFDGRASRSEYWWFALATALLSVLFFLPFAVIAGQAEATGSDDVPAGAIVLLILGLLVMLALAVPSIAVSVRRLHDGGFSGWLYLLNFVPYVGSLVVLVFMVLPPKPEGARYDRRPVGPGYYPG